ncbi:MAG TPA: VOC family protein [Pseudonocardiaceae bacterium]|jgi:glyoxylase I family protein|nr:VOC family protein [Pseudonocardiaceae bacterium]
MTGAHTVPLVEFSHVALNCRDQAVTADFYRDQLGFRRVRTVQLGQQEIVFLRNGRTLLELFGARGEDLVAPADDGPANPGVIRHLAFQTDDIDAFLAGLDDDVPISLGPLDFHDFIPGWRTVWLIDPDGVIVEVSQGYRDQE